MSLSSFPLICPRVEKSLHFLFKEIWIRPLSHIAIVSRKSFLAIFNKCLVQFLLIVTWVGNYLREVHCSRVERDQKTKQLKTYLHWKGQWYHPGKFKVSFSPRGIRWPIWRQDKNYISYGEFKKICSLHNSDKKMRKIWPLYSSYR